MKRFGRSRKPYRDSEHCSREHTKICCYSITVIIAAALLTMASIRCKASYSFTLCLIVWVALVIYGLSNIRERAALLVFLSSFFLFLLGGEATVQFLGYDLELSFTKQIDRHAHIAILISLIGIAAGFILMDCYVRKRKKTKPASMVENTPNMLIRKVGIIGVCCTMIPAFAQAIDAGLFVIDNGYLKYYTEYSCRLPSLVESLGELYTLFLFIYLATFPSKKKCILPLISYLIYGALWLISGRRLYIGISLLVIVFYIVVRHYYIAEERWITKTSVILCVAVVPLLVFGLYSYKYVRYGKTVETVNIFKIFSEFFNQQGVSINTIKLEKELEGDSLGCTSLYYTLKYWRSSILIRHIANFPYELYSIRSVETALNTNCLADYITYMKEPMDYLSGYGYGTSYIAELYHDGGYFLVLLGSALYGVLLKWLYNLSPTSPWSGAAALLILEQFVILPRYGADVIISPFYNLTRFAAFVGCILLVKLYSKTMERKRIKNEH